MRCSSERSRESRAWRGWLARLSEHQTGGGGSVGSRCAIQLSDLSLTEVVGVCALTGEALGCWLDDSQCTLAALAEGLLLLPERWVVGKLALEIACARAVRWSVSDEWRKRALTTPAEPASPGRATGCAVCRALDDASEYDGSDGLGETSLAGCGNHNAAPGMEGYA